MKKCILALVMTVSSFANAGNDPLYTSYETVLVSTFVTLFPTILTQCSIENTCDLMKVVVAGQEDAAAFVATEGAVKGVRLVQALEVLRANQAPNTPFATDMELAQVILSLN